MVPTERPLKRGEEMSQSLAEDPKRGNEGMQVCVDNLLIVGAEK